MPWLRSPHSFPKVPRLKSSPAKDSSPLPSLLLISATYVAEENRKKLAALAEHFDLTCVTCTQVRGMGMAINLRDQSPPAGYRLVGLKARGNPGSTTRYILRGLRKVIRDSRADTILVESEPWAFVRWQAWLWKKIHRPRALFGEFSWENIERHGLKGWILRCIYRAAVATDDFAITGNRDACELLRRRGMPASRILVSPQLGVDESLFHPAEPAERTQLRSAMGFPAGAFVVGFCGRLVSEKGVPDLVRAVESLRAKLPQRDIRLALIGHGALKAQLAEKASVAEWLRIFPARGHSEMAQFFQALDLFVLPSREIPGVWKEQFGHVLIEAMSSGVPVLGSDSGEIPRVIADPERTFPAGDVESLAQAIGQLAADDTAREKGIETQHAAVREKFTNSAVAGHWAAFLKSLPRGPSPVESNGWVWLVDTAITRGEAGPVRYLESDPSVARKLILCGALAAETEPGLQRRFSWLKNTGQKQRFFRYVGLLNIFRHCFRLRRATVIQCGSPHHFWWLIFLHRLGLFRVRNHLVFIYNFRSESFVRRAKWWNSAPGNFRAIFVSREQIEQLKTRGIRPGGICYQPCRVDTAWYAPPVQRRGGYLLVPGNIHRDEEFVLRLAKISPLPIIRVGQMGRLKDLYRASPVELRFNLSHSEFLDLLQNAAAVLLPIEECDEPAGLTAAMEALACETPLLANPSLEIGTLLTSSVGLAPIPTSAPEAWATAIRAILDGSLYPPEARRRGREFVIANHSTGTLRSPIGPVLESFASPAKPM